MVGLLGGTARKCASGMMQSDILTLVEHLYEGCLKRSWTYLITLSGNFVEVH